MKKRSEEIINYDPNDYERPSVTVDVIVFTIIDEALHVLLIKRKNPPYKNCWAFPGGFIEMSERLVESAVRELREETGIRMAKKRLRFLTVADDPNRDPRTRVIGSIYLALLPAHRLNPQAGDDAKEAILFPIDKAPRLAFDHRKLLNLAVSTFKNDLKHNSNLLLEMLPRGSSPRKVASKLLSIL